MLIEKLKKVLLLKNLILIWSKDLNRFALKGFKVCIIIIIYKSQNKCLNLIKLIRIMIHVLEFQFGMSTIS